jgi:hypothetical protein
MNDFGPFGLLASGVAVAALLFLAATVPVLLGRNLITRRPIATNVSAWLLYVLAGALLVLVPASFYFYAKHKGVGEYTTIKWVNIAFAAVFVFGNALRKFWHFRKRWAFWAELSVLIVAHFFLLSRLRWAQASYFWIILVIGLPELAVVFFLLRLGFNPKQPRTANEVADIIERFLCKKSLYRQEWSDFVECSERDSKLDTYRKRCSELDPVVNCPGPQDPKAIAELQNMVDELRQLQIAAEKASNH